MRGYSAVPTEDHEDDLYKNDTWTFQYGSQNKYHSIFTYSSSSNLDSYYFNKGHTEQLSDTLPALICHYFLVTWSYFISFLTAPVTLWFCIKKLPQHERALVFRLGRLQTVKGPGFIYVMPWIDRWKKVDLRMRAFSIPPQQLILADESIVEIGAEIRFRISNVVKSITRIRNLDESVRALGQAVLVNSLHQRTTTELTSERSIINGKIQAEMNAATLPWGLEVSQVDISPPKILHDGTGTASPLGSLLSSLQTVLQPSLMPASMPMANEDHMKDNVIHKIITEKVFPAVISNGTPNLEGAVYKLEISGKHGGIFWLDTRAGKTATGAIPFGWGAPDMTATISSEHFVALVNGTSSPLQAYIGGHVNITGNATLLNGLRGILDKLPTAEQALHVESIADDIQIV